MHKQEQKQTHVKISWYTPLVIQCTTLVEIPEGQIVIDFFFLKETDNWLVLQVTNTTHLSVLMDPTAHGKVGMSVEITPQDAT